MSIDQPFEERVSIIGAGQMGLVLAALLDSKGVPTTLWGHDPRHINELVQLRESRWHLPGFHLSPTIHITADDAKALEGCTMIVSAVPTQFIRTVFTRLRAHVLADVGILSSAKGIENETLLRPTAVIADAIRDDLDRPARPLCALSGPTIAEELSRCLPATMIAASDDIEFASRIQLLFTTSWMRIYTNADLVGVELAGATKNVIAIAAGIIDGLQAGINAKSALLARGLAEISRLGSAMGAQQETFFGIAGAGDLATTCFSPSGRNRSCGQALGQGKTLDEILAATQSVVEGVATTKSVMRLAKKYRVDMPITAAVHAILFENLDPIEAITRLMARQLKVERIG